MIDAPLALGALAPFVAVDIKGGAELLVVLLLVLASLGERIVRKLAQRKQSGGGAGPSLGRPRQRPVEDPLEGWKALLRGEAPPRRRGPAAEPPSRGGGAPQPSAPERAAEAQRAAMRAARERAQAAERRRSEGVERPDALGGLGPVPSGARLESGTGLAVEGGGEWLASSAFSEVPSEAQLERSGSELAGASPAPLAHDRAVPLRGIVQRDVAAAAGWRAAIVAAELLGPPLALRRPDRQPGALPG